MTQEFIRDTKGRWDKGNNSGTRFTSEMSKGNQHAKGNPPNKTSFKKGEFTMSKHKNWNGGIQRIKNDCVHIMVESNKRIRRPKHVWESVYGPLPDGYVIYHKNGNKHDDVIENLEAISRAELVRRNRRI